MYIFNKNIQKEIYRCFEQPTVALFIRQVEVPKEKMHLKKLVFFGKLNSFRFGAGPNLMVD